MFRYVALIWNTSDQRAAATARLVARRVTSSSDEWRCTTEAEGLSVFHADVRPGASEVYVLPNGGGVVLGKLFEQEIDASRVPQDIVLDVDEASAILSSAGRRLVQHYWGRYVAFLRDVQTGTTWVLRDPVGALPCFSTTFRGVSIFFSCTEDCVSIGVAQFSINWRYVGVFLCYPEVQTHETGLNEVSEIQAGECLEIRADATTKRILYWNPVLIASSDLIENIDEAVAQLGRTTKTCVWAWASCYPRIVHLLSGGLDSSIVLSCLRAAPTQPKITCLNYYVSSAKEADERVLARLAASAAHCELIESEERASAVRLQNVLDVSKSAKPWLSQYYVRHSHFEGQLAKDLRASAFFQGSGGDQVFYQGPVIHAAADYLYRYGARKDFFHVALNVARSEQLSIWSVLRTATRDAFLSPRWNPLTEIGKYRSFVNSEVVRSAREDDSLVHPWLKARDGVPRGKLFHILMMAVSHDFYDPLGLPDGPERIRPLVSQPLLELCLRIPTYVLTAGGWDRAIARRAFESEVSVKIISRRSKGVIDRYLHQLLRSNLEFVREMLLDGLLVRENLLDRRKIEDALSRASTNLSPGDADLVGVHLGTEAWLRGWAEARKRAVA